MGTQHTDTTAGSSDNQPTSRRERLDAAFDADAGTVTDEWEGAAIYTSWGYGQTNVNLAAIVEVSDSGKTVLARMVRADVETHSNGSEGVRPTEECYGEPFRLHVWGSSRGASFRGSYPYIDGDPETGTRLDSFIPVAERDSPIHQTPTNRGH
ncbi:hypothetical protein [Halorubrum aethiopicum]|uniref:hypothetical protein n=1 Tax=Halorubrum aethiopicum TaxID=1758255 RepID=UPI00082B22D8|nr:hypothetical protein [Halorubrum aethiopicum]